jgi:mono/diheme cytochrome c family protein
MKMSFPRVQRFLLCTTVILAMSCAGDTPPLSTTMDFPGMGAGKADVFGRALAGVAAPYEADFTLRAETNRLSSDMGFRRQVAWDIAYKVLEPVPLLGLANAAEAHEDIELPGGVVPQVPRFQSWYGVEDFKRMFKRLYGELTPEERADRAPFSPSALEEVETWNASAQERSERWPLERFFKHVESLGTCPAGMPADQCAQSLQSQFSGAAAGNARITYSPSAMLHLLGNYSPMLDCLESLDSLNFDQPPIDADTNFTFCFNTEFPVDSVLMKAQWVRADFGRNMPAFDTDGEALTKILSNAATANWGKADREVDPSEDSVYTIRLRNGDTYRLAALHIITKELRHWVWVTMWWSDLPDSDFGEDRPEVFANLPGVWSNYKMSVVVDYEEKDPNPAASFPNQPSLQAALNATSGNLSWASNPYIEHGQGNANTNCIGCHQHGGSSVGHDLDGDGTPDPFDLEMVIENGSLFPNNGRSQMRTLFPADYLWATQRVDNLGQLLASEVAHFDFIDQDLPEVRAVKILRRVADPIVGEAHFQKNCTPCHGPEGLGTNTAPNLNDRVPFMNDHELTVRLLLGKSPMPSWSHLPDDHLADLRAYLRQTFQ